MDINVLIPIGIFILCGAAALAMLALFVMLINTNKLIKDMQTKLNPLMDRGTLTIDAVNLEIMRVDQLMEDLSGVTANLQKTTGQVDNVVSAPANLVGNLAGKIRNTLGSREFTNQRVSNMVNSVDASLGNLDDKIEARKVVVAERQAEQAAADKARSASVDQANQTSSNIKDAIAAHVGTDSGAAVYGK